MHSGQSYLSLTTRIIDKVGKWLAGSVRRIEYPSVKHVSLELSSALLWNSVMYIDIQVINKHIFLSIGPTTQLQS